MLRQCGLRRWEDLEAGKGGTRGSAGKSREELVVQGRSGSVTPRLSTAAGQSLASVCLLICTGGLAPTVL